MGSAIHSKMERLPALGVAGIALYVFVLRHRQLAWGATDEEAVGAVPGDDLIPDADLTATRGITIRHPAHEVWPWIAQIGQSRGGFYSYDGLENLVRCFIHCADRVVQEWQQVNVGDAVRLAPEVALEVVVADPGHALVLRGDVPMGSMAPPYEFTWAFALREKSDSATRLLVRERYRYTRGWAPLLVEPVAIISWVMSQKMVRRIRDRAERVVG